MRASFYKALIQAAARWGYVVIQYDLPWLSSPPDSKEVGPVGAWACCKGALGTRGWPELPVQPPARPPARPPQLKLFAPLRAWLDAQSREEGSRLHGMVDVARLAVAGHSRGGKLAALAFAGEQLPPLLCSALLCSALLCSAASQQMPPEGQRMPRPVRRRRSDC
jgi:hypothetical protein